jgi:6-phosphogluconate dehydrogenase
MQIGLIGSGKAGSSLALKLKDTGYEVVACDISETTDDAMTAPGIHTFTAIEDFTLALKSKRVIWLMLPPGGIVDQTIQGLKFRLAVGDIIIDGSNSRYNDTIRRAKEMEALQIDYLDYGIREGTAGLLKDIGATIGGNRFAFNYCERIFNDLTVHNGYRYCGTSGSGHFVQMIQTRIEQGHLQTIAEEVEAMQEFKLNPIVRNWLIELLEDKGISIRKSGNPP